MINIIVIRLSSSWCWALFRVIAKLNFLDSRREYSIISAIIYRDPCAQTKAVKESRKLLNMGSLGVLEKMKPHVVVFPYPSQGHINPLMEFAKRLASRNLRVTFVLTEENKERMSCNGALSASSKLNIRFETISDGLPTETDRFKDVDMVLDLLKRVGGETFENLLKRLNAEGERVSCVVYDSFLEWVSGITKKFNIPSAFFWTQSCAVYSIYYHFHKSLVEMDESGKAKDTTAIAGLPRLRLSDLPTFLQPSNADEGLKRLVTEQLRSLLEVTWVLGNSFDQLESEEIESMKSHFPIRTVGPLLPSAFVDGKNPQDTDVGTHMWKAANCLDWLDTKGESTVVYVSFGSVAVISKEQMHEIALGLKASGHSFLWVIRPGRNEGEKTSAENLPERFVEESSEQGLIVPWCPQVKVLNHPSIAAFMTHSGWNSTLEGLSSGVPLLAIPQWSDQPTNSKYIEEEWKTGIRLNKREDGVVGRDEVEKALRTVMESEGGVDLRKNALRWKTLARQAMAKGGSSDKNIDSFVEEVISRASSMSSTVA